MRLRRAIGLGLGPEEGRLFAGGPLAFGEHGAGFFAGGSVDQVVAEEGLRGCCAGGAVLGDVVGADVDGRGEVTILMAAALLWARVTPLDWPSDVSMISLRLVTSEGTLATVKVNVVPWQAMVAAPGFSTPTSAEGLLTAVPPQATTQ